MSGSGDHKESCDVSLNESPSQKEGKFNSSALLVCLSECLNESPSQKEGK